MTDSIAFELVSPVKKLMGKPVAMVTMPGSEGDFSVLPGHAPVIATLRPGVVEVYEATTVTDRIFVAGGFAEVTAERCTVLAQEAVPVKELSRGAIETDIAAINSAMQDAANDAERDALTARLAVAEAKRDVAA